MNKGNKYIHTTLLEGSILVNQNKLQVRRKGTNKYFYLKHTKASKVAGRTYIAQLFGEVMKFYFSSKHNSWYLFKDIDFKYKNIIEIWGMLLLLLQPVHTRQCKHNICVLCCGKYLMAQYHNCSKFHDKHSILNNPSLNILEITIMRWWLLSPLMVPDFYQHSLIKLNTPLTNKVHSIRQLNISHMYLSRTFLIIYLPDSHINP